MSKPSAQDLFLNNYLRGLAILAVIAIHTLASIHADYWPSTPGWWLAIAADQLARFAVPLFVALSGYSFWQKYRDAKSLNWFTFIWHQAKKLMPLYLLASAVFYVVFLILPSWRVGGTPPSFFEQLWRGRADYQLYFVPMIFQLYALFPLLRLLVKKFPWSSLLAAFLFQLILYLVFTYDPSGTSLVSDQQQYYWFFTWIFYFVLGMHLPPLLAWFRRAKNRELCLFLFTFLSWVMVSAAASLSVGRGIDPIVAMRFTRPSVLIYASSFILAAFVFTARLSPRRLPMLWLGKNSYPLYLFHTLALRAVFAL